MDAAILWSVFTGSFLAATLLPGGSEILLAFAASEFPGRLLALWLVASLGNTLGGFTGWLIGRWLVQRFPDQQPQRADRRRALERLQHHGAPILLLAWLPLIGDPLCVAAGWLKIPWPQALAFMFVGKAARYAVLVAPFLYQ